MEFNKTWSRMGNAPSKIPLKFGGGSKKFNSGWMSGCSQRVWLWSRCFQGESVVESFGRGHWWRGEDAAAGRQALWKRDVEVLETGISINIYRKSKSAMIMIQRPKHRAVSQLWTNVSSVLQSGCTLGIPPLFEEFMSKISEHGSFIWEWPGVAANKRSATDSLFFPG